MSKRIITGAVIALAAGLAAFIYQRKRNKINEAAAEAYNRFNEGLDDAEDMTDGIFA